MCILEDNLLNIIFYLHKVLYSLLLFFLLFLLILYFFVYN